MAISCWRESRKKALVSSLAFHSLTWSHHRTLYGHTTLPQYHTAFSYYHTTMSSYHMTISWVQPSVAVLHIILLTTTPLSGQTISHNLTPILNIIRQNREIRIHAHESTWTSKYLCPAMNVRNFKIHEFHMSSSEQRKLEISVSSVLMYICTVCPYYVQTFYVQISINQKI